MYACHMPQPGDPAAPATQPTANPQPGRPGLVPRLFADDDDALAEGTLTIRGPKARRLNRVLRLRRDDPLEVVHPPTGRVYALRIERSTPEAVTAEIASSRLIAAPRPPASSSASP